LKTTWLVNLPKWNETLVDHKIKMDKQARSAVVQISASGAFRDGFIAGRPSIDLIQCVKSN